MTINVVQNPIAINNDELTQASSTQKYPLGLILAIENGDGYQDRYMYVKSHGALTQYQPYVLDFSSTAGSQFITGAPATLAAPGRQVVIPQIAVTSGYYAFVLIEGDGKVLMIAETYAVGDHLQILNAGAALVVDGTSGATTFSVNSCAVCKEAGTTAVARDVLLMARQAVVAAT